MSQTDSHLEVLWGFKGHQVRQELEQEHQRFLAARMVTTASPERHLQKKQQRIVLVEKKAQ